jgi:hypothetical protein
MASMQIEVYDERPETFEVRGSRQLVAKFENVPEGWDSKRVLEEFGIAEHFTVYRSTYGGKRTVIQRGRQTPSLPPI